MNERRIENRFACADLVRVEWVEGEGRLHSTEAVLEDISRIGGCVEVDEPIPPGATIIIALGEAQLYGQVCYCVFRDYGYFVGVQFSADSTWSSGTAEPAHLTDFRQIAALLT
ncbi:MAG TPA: PilZ domain-containing protein, partial [Bryobacteraceae bacterium]|nr:PilZ domain-containing protein [Bryobacteraceae bacterium]